MVSEPMTDVLRETLALFDEAGEPRTTTEVADLLGLGRRSTYERLERLVDHGCLDTKKVGANARVWWRPPPHSNRATSTEDQKEFESLVEAVEEYAIFTLDTEGYIQTWNPGAEQITGYSAEDILDRHFSAFYTVADREAGVPDRNLAEAKKHGSAEDQGWRLREDGTKFWANVTITAIRDDEGDLTGFAKVTRDMTARHEYEEQLRQERDLVERIFETTPVGISVLSPNGDIIRANQRAEEMLGITEGTDTYTAGDLQVYDPDGTPVPPDERPYGQVLESGDPILDWQCQIECPSGDHRWLSVNAAPLEGEEGEVTQIVTTGDDITQHKEQAQRLGRQRDELESELEEIFTRIDDAFFAIDEDWRFTYVNDRAAEMVQLSPGELIGERVWDALPEVAEVFRRETAERAMESHESFEFEFYSEFLDSWIEIRGYPSESGMSVYARDVTTRKKRERELTQYETLFEESKDVNVIVAPDGTFRYVTPSATNVFGYEPEDLVGEVGFEYIHPEDREKAMAEFTKMLETPGYEPRVEFRFERNDESWIVLEALARDLRDDPDIAGVVIYTRDVTERVERNRELERYETVIETVDDGVYAVDEEYRFTMVNEGYVQMTGYAREELIGSHISMVVGEDIVALGERLREGLLEGDTDSGGIELKIETADGDRLTVETRFALAPSDDEFCGTVGVVRDVSGRIERERELERQREHLDALNSLNVVVREITDAVIDQSTRKEIETIVCGRLAEADSYAFAWIAEVEPKTETIRPRVEAGVDGYLQEIPLSSDPDNLTGQGPAGRAVRTGEIQVSQDVLVDPDFEPWREYAEQYGYRSAAAIPIVHDDTLYGLLGVYAARPKAFGREEREVVSQLGEVVGHAIASTERKQALMSDEVTEITFAAAGVLDSVGVDSAMKGTITFDRAVPVGDDTFLEYGAVDPAAIDVLEALADRHPDIEELTIGDRMNDPIPFELRASEPPVISVVASHGGYVQVARIEDGDLQMTIHLPPTVAASRVIDAVEETYPTVNLLARRQITRDTISARAHRTVTEDLTDRQRAALEAAIYSGFFEWPRHASAEDIADSLDVAPPTFHQHLRKAQKKVFDSLYPVADQA